MIYITGCAPPVVHFDARCFGIIGGAGAVDVNKIDIEELGRLFLCCVPCYICASSFDGDLEVRRLELKRLGHEQEVRDEKGD